MNGSRRAQFETEICVARSVAECAGCSGEEMLVGRGSDAGVSDAGWVESRSRILFATSFWDLLSDESRNVPVS